MSKVFLDLHNKLMHMFVLTCYSLVSFNVKNIYISIVMNNRIKRQKKIYKIEVLAKIYDG